MVQFGKFVSLKKNCFIVTGVPNQDDTLESSENQKEEILEQIKKENIDTQDANDSKAKLKSKLSLEENLIVIKKEVRTLFY